MGEISIYLGLTLFRLLVYLVVIKKHKNSALCFYVYSKIYSGYKFREATISNKYELLILEVSSSKNDLNSRWDVTTKPKRLFLDDLGNLDNIIITLNDKYYRLEDLIEREYKKQNNLGEYYREEFDNGNSDSIDYFESLDPNVFVNVINL